MVLLTDNIYVELLILLTTAIALIANYFHQSYQYWSRKNVPTIQPKFPLGNSNAFLPQAYSPGVLTKNYYDSLKKDGHKFGGVYLMTSPNLVVTDPDLIKDILLKDFQHFVDRGFYYNKKDDPISAHLFAVDGADWKNLRVKLTPTFTSGKMKTMFDTIVSCSKFLQTALEDTLGQDIEIKDMLGKFTVDVVGSCAFGVQCNSFKDPNAEFRTMGRKIFQTSFTKSLRSFFIMNKPKWALKMGLLVMAPSLKQFFERLVRETVELRKADKIKRNDYLQILLDLKETSQFSTEDLTAQALLFFLAGFETSSTLMTYALYELAKNGELQEKLRNEINTVLGKYDNKLTYESVKEMQYLGQILDEASRMYPPVPTINRRCTKNYKLADTNVTIEEGTPVLIPVLGLHMDPEYYPEPEKFDPSRFGEENKHQRHPFSFLPFGDGPRNCIGLRFGQMQSKIGVITVVKNFKISVSPKTTSIEFNPYVFLLASMKPVYLKIEKL